jgi:hypothetical protein
MQIEQDQTSRSGPKRNAKGAPELEPLMPRCRHQVAWPDRLGGSLGQVITLSSMKKRRKTFIAIRIQNRHKCASYDQYLELSDRPRSRY